MVEKLTKEDFQILKYQLRGGIVISALIFIIGITISIFVSLDIAKTVEFSKITVVFSAIIIMLLVSFSVFKMSNGKYLTDIKNREKVLKKFKIERKEAKLDTEAGSGNLSIDGNMKTFIRYDIIVKSTRYRVDQKFFEACTEGDEVLFHIAPKSDFRLYIQLKKDKNFKFS